MGASASPGFRYTAMVRRSVPLLLLILAGCESPRSTVPATVSDASIQPDVLLVVLDTVRADRLSTYGHHLLTSPQLDEVGRAGVVFEDVTTAGSWTWPAHASIFTGTPPWVHGAHIQRDALGGALAVGHLGAMPMRRDLPTLAERFSAAGYQTTALSANVLLSPDLGLTRGFDSAVFLPDHAVATQAESIAKNKDEAPLFMFINFMGAHAPWNLSPAQWSAQHAAKLSPATGPNWTLPFLSAAPVGLDLYRTPTPAGLDGFQLLHTGALQIPAEDMAWVNDLYDGQVAVSDYLLHRVLRAWSAARPNSVVAVVSDHGEYLGEHGMWEHGKTVYPEVVKVPMVIAAPGRLKPGQRVSTPVQLRDIYPTLLDLSGVQVGAPGSLLAVMASGERPGPILAKAWSGSVWAKLVGGRFAHDWGLIRAGDVAIITGSDGTLERYDLAQDPTMKVDLHPHDPVPANAMMTRFEGVFAEAPRPDEAQVTLPKQVMERLQALGYVAD